MSRCLAILEVSQKQAYIFGSKKLMENAVRSERIRRVTEEMFLSCGAGPEHLVYSGGGHTILQFTAPTAEGASGAAWEVLSQLSARAYREYEGMELFTKILPYEENESPSWNLDRLLEALERKKSLRVAAFRRKGTGLERLDGVTFQPVKKTERDTARAEKLPERGPWKKAHPTMMEDLVGKENFVAIIHIDGNNLGKKSQQVTDSAGSDWEAFCRVHQRFSRWVDRTFQEALARTICQVETWQATGKLTELGFDAKSKYHPIRPIIAAGDDICFVTAGSLGYACATFFLHTLCPEPKAEVFERDEMPQTLSACAGVALVPVKYPFYQGYSLSEELCDHAKRYAAQLREAWECELPSNLTWSKADLNQRRRLLEQERISTLDWHIEFGGGRDSIQETRQDYLTEDTGAGIEKENPLRTMTLRPLAVIAPNAHPLRTEKYFCSLAKWLAEKSKETGKGAVPRSKVKNLRNAMHQGELETQLYLKEQQITQLTNWVKQQLEAQLGKEETINGGFALLKEGGEYPYVSRGLFFDAIELSDHLILPQEES